MVSESPVVGPGYWFWQAPQVHLTYTKSENNWNGQWAFTKGPEVREWHQICILERSLYRACREWTKGVWTWRQGDWLKDYLSCDPWPSVLSWVCVWESLQHLYLGRQARECSRLGWVWQQKAGTLQLSSNKRMVKLWHLSRKQNILQQ